MLSVATLSFTQNYNYKKYINLWLTSMFNFKVKHVKKKANKSTKPVHHCSTIRQTRIRRHFAIKPNGMRISVDGRLIVASLKERTNTVQHKNLLIKQTAQ